MRWSGERVRSSRSRCLQRSISGSDCKTKKCCVLATLFIFCVEELLECLPVGIYAELVGVGYKSVQNRLWSFDEDAAAGCVLPAPLDSPLPCYGAFGFAA